MDVEERIYEFTAVIEHVPDRHGAFVRFPWDIRQEFGSLVNMGVKNPDGSVCYIIGVRKDIQAKIGKGPGDTVSVAICAWRDRREHT